MNGYLFVGFEIRSFKFQGTFRYIFNQVVDHLILHVEWMGLCNSVSKSVYYENIIANQIQRLYVPVATNKFKGTSLAYLKRNTCEIAL